MKFNDEQEYYVSTFLTDKFICIKVYTMYGMYHADPNVPNILLSVDIDSKTLGEAIVIALSKSRTITKEEFLSIPELATLEIRKEIYKQWYQDLMEKYEYKSKRALFKDMKNCDISLLKENIVIEPTNHEKLEGWGGEGISEEDYVVLPLDSQFEEIGEGLRLAFSRCI